MAKIIGNTTSTTMAMPHILTEEEVVQLIAENSIREIEDGSVSYEKLSEDLTRRLVGKDTYFGHKGYYIDSINTKEKWIMLSDSPTKPNFPAIGDNVIDWYDISSANTPYTGVYKVTSDKDVTLTNETGHTVTLTAGEAGYLFLIKGKNNIEMSDNSATLTFNIVENQGLDYMSSVQMNGDYILTDEHIYHSRAMTIPANSSVNITLDIEQSGMYYLSYQKYSAATNEEYIIKTDTGFYGAIKNTTVGWNHNGEDGNVEYVYLRIGLSTITIENPTSSAVVLDQVRISKTSNYSDNLSWDNVKIAMEEGIPSISDSTQNPTNPEESLGYDVGDTFSLVNGAHYDFCGTISRIKGNKIWYNEDLPFNTVDKTTNDLDDHIFFVPSKPDVGIVNIVTIAFATGDGTKAVGYASFCAGRDNISGGDYSFVAGRNNLASYCAAAFGLNTQAKGRYTFSAGYFARAFGEYSVAINNYTIVRGENSFAHGCGTLATGDSMVVGGKYNDTEDGVIVVYGNGDSWDNRRDAYTLDWNGNGWFAGGLKIGGESPEDAEDVLVESQIINLIRQYSSDVDLSNYMTRTQVISEINGILSKNYYDASEVNNTIDNKIRNINLDSYLYDYYTKTEVDNQLTNIESVAKGRSTGYVFNTIDEMNDWLLYYDNKSKLNLGDNLYIRAKDVPDYWWDGSQPQELETQKVDLTDFVLKSAYETDLSNKADVDSVDTKLLQKADTEYVDSKIAEVASLIDSKINDAILSLIGGSY